MRTAPLRPPSSTPAPPPAAAAGAERGFTLVELLVSLTSGLIVALGVFALAKSATNTFYNEQRVAGAEMSLRSAIDRVRADLQRAAFMSTGNYLQDPAIATAVSGIRTTGFSGIDSLAGIRLFQGHSLAATSTSSGPYMTINGLAPDQIDIGGNFTSVDEFVIKAVSTAGACTRLYLNTDTPPMYRLFGSAMNASQGADGAYSATTVPPSNTTTQTAIRGVFQASPWTVGGSTDQDAGAQFIVRIVDETGLSQFLPTCAGNNAGNLDATGVWVDVAGAPVSAAQTGAVGGVSGVGTGRMTVNGVQYIRYQIASIADIYGAHGRAVPSSLSALSTGDPAQLFLVRSYLDARRNYSGPPELVAEYAVDLKFGFTVDAAQNNTGALPVFLPLAIGDSANGTYAYDLSTTNTQFNGPQRIRSARVRLSTRTNIPDRSGSVGGGDAAVYTFCLVPDAANLSACSQLSRMRTITSEVSLPNQALAFY